MLKLADLAVRPDFDAGTLLVSPSRRIVRGPQGEIHLEPRIMQVFLLLLDARGRVVTRNEIFDQCWGGAMVGDDSVNRAIAGVRRIASEVAPGAFEIETIPRTGYRMVGDVTRMDEVDEGNDAAIPRVSRRTLIAGGVAATGIASVGLWAVLEGRKDARVTQLIGQADQILRYELSDRRLSAIPLLEQATAIDPRNGAALGLLAYARAIAATATPRGNPEAVPIAEKAIKAALASDSKDPHARLAVLLIESGGFEWAATEDKLRAILAIAPRNSLAMSWLVALYQAAGRNRLSWAVNERQIAIDSYSPAPQYRKALKHWIFGRTGEAYRLADRLIQMWPGHPWVWNARFLILAFTGRAHAALDMIDDAASRPKTITPERMAQWRPTLAALDHPTPAAIAAARDANLEAARQSPGQAAYAVMALAGINEVDAAHDVAEGFLLAKGRIVTRRPTDRANLLVNNPTWRHTQWISTPPMSAFRESPRFGPLCDGIGLTAYWRARGILPDYPRIQPA